MLRSVSTVTFGYAQALRRIVSLSPPGMESWTQTFPGALLATMQQGKRLRPKSALTQKSVFVFVV